MAAWRSRTGGALAALLLAVGVTSCADGLGPGGGVRVRAQLVRLPGSVPLPVRGLAPAGQPLAPEDRTWSSAVEIASLLVPIRSIYLYDGADRSERLYECAADTNDGCLVDLAGPALEDLLGAGPVTVRPGTYTGVRISTCRDEGDYEAVLTGTVTLAGRTWVTSTAAVLDTLGAPGPVRLSYHGCSRSYDLPAPLAVAGDSVGGPVTVRLYFDIRDIAWGSLGEAATAGAWIPSGCAGPRPAAAPPTPFLCAGYPDVAGVVDTVVPVLERYRVNDGATLGLIFHGSSGAFVGGFSRRYFREGAPAEPGFNADTPVQEFVRQDDGTYLLTTWGGSGPDGGAVGHYLTMRAFRRESHAGTATDFAGREFPYTVVRIE